MARDKSPEDYVREVTESTLSFMQDLRRELAGAHSRIQALETEKSRMQSDIAALRAELGRRDAQVNEIGERERSLTDQFRVIEERNANLASLYVASYRLHETVERSEVLSIIQEIVINVIGSEELGIYELDAAGELLTLTSAFGLEDPSFSKLSARRGSFARAVSRAEIVQPTAEDRERGGPQEENLTACIPLTLSGKVLGVLAVFRLLPHKQALTRVDHELFELLATHAATALYCANLHARYVTERTASSGS